VRQRKEQIDAVELDAVDFGAAVRSAWCRGSMGGSESGPLPTSRATWRCDSPWNGRTMTRGMEFGVSPFPETRRQMIERGTLFDTPCYRWIEARGELTVRYHAAIGRTGAV
jgi:hypothetical protein